MLMPEKVQEKLWDMQGKVKYCSFGKDRQCSSRNPVENVLNNACTART